MQFENVACRQKCELCSTKLFEDWTRTVVMMICTILNFEIVANYTQYIIITHYHLNGVSYNTQF